MHLSGRLDSDYRESGGEGEWAEEEKQLPNDASAVPLLAKKKKTAAQL